MGFDLMFGENLKAYILEINYSPSLNILFTKDEEYGVSGRRSSSPAANRREAIVDPVDLYVKKRVAEDAIKLALAKSDNPGASATEFNSLRVILPN